MPFASSLAISALALALQTAAPPAPPAAAAAPPETSETAASSAFLEVCLAGLAANKTAAEYAANSDEVGRSFGRDHANLPGVTVEGFDGRACRMRYTGPHSGVVFADLTGMTSVSGCNQTDSSEVLIRSACTVPNGGATGDIEIIRPQPTDQAPITATVVYQPSVPAPSTSSTVPTARP